MVHRFQEIIGGQAYRIEVTSADGRWRAALERRPGALTATMPFYAGSPEEASGRLIQWLTLAHDRRAARPADGRPQDAPGRPAGVPGAVGPATDRRPAGDR